MCYEDPLDPDDLSEDDASSKRPPEPFPDLAPNGEGQLGSAPVWFDVCEATAPLKAVILQIGLAKAIADSAYVADVMSVLQTGLSTEAFELFVRVLHESRPLYLKLRTKVVGTLFGDFIRFCRGANPGVSAASLATMLQRSPLGLVRSFTTWIDATNQAADDFRKKS